MMDLQENLQQVEANICKACENAGRKRSDVTLIAVSKTKPIEMLQTVYDLGPRDFGENKVQEMCEKMEVLPKDIRWHMIGHLQTNKVKYIIGKTELIHSVDSLHLAKEIEKQAAKQNVTSRFCLVFLRTSIFFTHFLNFILSKITRPQIIYCLKHFDWLGFADSDQCHITAFSSCVFACFAYICFYLLQVFL